MPVNAEVSRRICPEGDDHSLDRDIRPPSDGNVFRRIERRFTAAYAKDLEICCF